MCLVSILYVINNSLFKNPEKNSNNCELFLGTSWAKV